MTTVSVISERRRFFHPTSYPSARWYAIGLGLVLLAGCGRGTRHAELAGGTLGIALNGRGEIRRLIDLDTGSRYTPSGISSPLLSVRIDSVLISPRSSRWQRRRGLLTLHYPGGVTATVGVEMKATHLTIELLAITPDDDVELVVWGPYATTINSVIGETVGVVRDSVFAIGLQALNPKTLGGYPWHENDCMPQLDIFEADDYSDLSEEGKRYVLYRVEAAKPEDFGSTLQAYCRNRRRARMVQNWNHDRYVAPPFEDGGVTGSKIALFGSSADRALETIGAIEVAEGLPHPIIDGEWGKTAPGASAAYLILNFGEADIDRALAWTRQAGLRFLYHGGPFRTWGHFELNEQFPNGRAGLRACVERAGAAGIMLGVHTLSNFITTNDAYVTPEPDSRLAKVGSSTLTASIDPEDTEIGLADPGFFNQFRNNHLRAVVIGSELITYTGVSEQAPWRLLGCERGAFGTRAAAHGAGDEIAKLADHGYRVFLTDADLGREVAGRIAQLFNETGLRQISFDGLEGNRSTGMGNYGEVLFTTTWFDNLSPEIHRHYIADASRTSHYFWHIYSRMNWGEPWYAGFRESQTEYRLKNQAYFRRNLMPGMLGWFQMRPGTTLADVEWMLARSAAFDAGYSFVTSYETLETNGNTDAILDAIGRWERARMAGVFSADQKRRMEDVAAEFHLEDAEGGNWLLTPVAAQIFRHARPQGPPGEPTTSTFTFTVPAPGQILPWIMTAVDGEIAMTVLQLDHRDPVRLSVRLPAGWSLRYEGGTRAILFDPTWHPRRSVVVDPADWRVEPGEHAFLVDCMWGHGDEEMHLRLEVRPTGVPEPVPAVGGGR